MSERARNESTSNSDAPVVGIFVGGKGERMGFKVKALLRTASGETILGRLVTVVREVWPNAELVLVGENAALLDVELPRLVDSPRGVGPLGGLRALLLYAEGKEKRALALASDLPLVMPELLQRLACEAEDAPFLAPRLEGLFQPLFARYTPSAMLPAIDEVLRTGRKSLLSVLDRARGMELVLDSLEAGSILDWDRPEDLPPPLREQLN